MASALIKLFSSVFGARRNRKIVILGLDGAGGIELLQRLCGEPIEKIKDERTWGIIYTATDYKLKCDFVVVEVGGSAKPAHHLWLAAQFCDADGFIWIVDATDTDHLEESKEEMAICRKGRKLSKGLEQPGVRPDAPWLILLDFKETPLCITEATRQAELITKDAENDLDWTFRAISAVTAERLKEAVGWLYQKVL